MLIPILNYSQNRDSIQKRNSLGVGVFISGGIIVAVFYSDKFTNDLYSKTHNNIVIPPGFSLFQGKTSPQEFDYTKSSVGPNISIGLELNSRKHKNVKHLFEASYIRFSGNYSYTIFYGYSSIETHSIYDTAQIIFAQNKISIGYRLQPTYRSMFLALGVNFSVNIMRFHEKKKEVNDFKDEFGNQLSKSISNSTSSSDLGFINSSMQLGIGYCMKVKSFVLKPIFYFTPLKGYNFYNASLGVLWIIDKKK